MEGVRSRLASWLGLARRQSSIGLKVPCSKPKTKDDALVNLEYARQEVEVCDKSIAHDAKFGGHHRMLAAWLLRYMDVAIIVAKDADTKDALALSTAALWVLPRLNPYAEKFYDFSSSSPGTSDNHEAVAKLAKVYQDGLIKLGRIIVDISPQTSSLDAQRDTTMQEDYATFDLFLPPD